MPARTALDQAVRAEVVEARRGRAGHPGLVRGERAARSDELRRPARPHRGQADRRAGARDVVVHTEVAAVERWASKAGLPSDEPPRLIAEIWIDAPMLPVDGLMAGGKVRTAMVGRYTAKIPLAWALRN